MKTGTLRNWFLLAAFAVTTLAGCAGGPSGSSTENVNPEEIGLGNVIVTITSPLDNGLYNVADPIFSYTVTEGENNDPVSLDRVVAKLHDLVDANRINTRTVGNIDSGAPLPALEDGVHELEVVVLDVNGNPTVTVVVGFTTDTVPADIRFDGNWYGDGTDSFNYRTNEDSPVLSYTVDDECFTTNSCTERVFIDGLETSSRNGDPLPPLSDGEHELVIVFADAAGNQTTVGQIFFVDGTAPIVTLNENPAPGEGAAPSPFDAVLPGHTVNSTDAALNLSVNEPAEVMAFLNPAESCQISLSVLVEPEDNTSDGEQGGDSGEGGDDGQDGDNGEDSDSSQGNDGTATLQSLVTFDCEPNALGAAPVNVLPDEIVTLNIAGLFPGQHTVLIVARDEIGNVSVLVVTFTKADIDAPTVTLSEPFGVKNVRTVPLDYTVSDDDTLLANLVVSVRVEQIDATGTWAEVEGYVVDEVAGTITLDADGAYRASVSAIDNGQNVTTVTSLFSVDTAAPLVTISAPVGDVTAAKPLLTYDGGGDSIAGEAVYLFSGPYDEDAQQTSDATAVPYRSGDLLSLATGAGLTDGVYTVVVDLTDSGGNTGRGHATFTVNAAPPAVTVLKPLADTDYAWGAMTVEYQATQFTRIEIYTGLTGNPESEQLAAPPREFILPAPPNNIYTDTITFNAGGEYTVRVLAIDETGLQPTAEAAVDVLIDPTLPGVTILAPPVGTYVQPDDVIELDYAVTGTASSLTVYVNSTAQPGINLTTPTPVDIGPLEEGTHNLKVRVANPNGFTTDTRQVIVDGTAPQVIVSVPEDGLFYPTANVSLAFSVNEPTSAVTVWLDGNEQPGLTGGGLMAGLTAGPHTVEVQAVDMAGNLSVVQSIDFNVDTSAPEVTIVGPQDGKYLNSSAVTLTYTINEANVASQTVWLDGQEQEGAQSGTTFLELIQGEHTLGVQVTDQAGNESELVETTFFVDVTLPQVTINSPKNGAAYIRDSIDLTYTVNEANLSGQTVWVNGVETGLLSGDKVEQLGSGYHYVEVQVTDVADNPSAIVRSTFRVDLDAPGVTISSPADGSTHSVSTVNLSYSVTEPELAFERVWLNGVEMDGMTNGDVFTGLITGDYFVEVQVEDAAGNLSTKERSTFRVDVDNPMVNVTSPAHGAIYTSDTVLLTYTVVENEGGSDQQVWLDGVLMEGMVSGDSFTGLALGTHVVRVQATDLAGNQSLVAEVIFAVDNVRPKVTITSPADGSVYTVSTVTLAYTVSEEDLASHTVTLNGEPMYGMVSGDVLTGLATGTYYVDVQVEDLAGNLSDVVRSTFTVDTERPQVTITSPIENHTYTTSSLAVIYTVSEPELGVQRIWLNGEEQIGMVSGGILTDLQTGTYVVKVQVEDAAGNESEVEDVYFRVDRTLPVVTLTQPLHGSVLTANEVRLQYTVSEEDLLSETVTLDGDVIEGAASGTLLSGLSEGKHSVTVQAEDGAGNLGPVAKSIFTVDTQRPQVTIATPAQGAVYSTSVIQLRYKVSLSDYVAEEVHVDGVLVQGLTSGGLITGLTTGTHTVAVRAKDSSGFWGEWATTTFSVDVDSPVVTIISPAADTTYSTDSVQLQFTVSEDPIAGVTVKVDGTVRSDLSNGSLISDLATGAHTVEVQATDTAGNTGQPTLVAFAVDTEGPGITSVTSPEEGKVYTTQSVPLQYNVSESDLSAEIVKLDGVEQPGLASGGVLDVNADGSHFVSIQAVDAFGNAGPVKTVNFSVDTQSPVVTAVTSPVEGATYTTGEVLLHYSFGSDDVAEQIVKVDGVVVPGLVSGSLMVGLTTGTHFVEIRGVDFANNLGPVATVNFSVDTERPVVTITSPVAGTLYDSSDVDLNFSVSGGDLAFAEVWVDGQPSDVANGGTVTGLTTGSHFIEVRATDQAGNVGQKASVNFAVDIDAPVVTIISPASAALYGSDEVALEFTVSEDELSSLVVKVDGVEQPNMVSGDTITGLATGSHFVDIRATDAAGNEGAVATVNFTVDVTKPVLTLNSPADGASYTTGDVPLEFAVANEDSVASVLVRLDGEEVSGMENGDLFTGLGLGGHVVEVQVTDGAGNASAVALAEFNVIEPPPDAPKPTVTIEKPRDGVTIDGDDLVVRYTYDSLLPLATVRVVLDNGSEQSEFTDTFGRGHLWSHWRNWRYRGDRDEVRVNFHHPMSRWNRGRHIITVDNLEPGNYTLSIQVIDKDGNASARDTVSFEMTTEKGGKWWKKNK